MATIYVFIMILGPIALFWLYVGVWLIKLIRKEEPFHDFLLWEEEIEN